MNPRALCVLFSAGSILFAANSFAAVHYVDVNSASPTPPYSSWGTAASVIQDAIDACSAGDEVIVTNGTYATGGRAVSRTMNNRVSVTKALLVHIVNGPRLTM